MTTQQVKVWDLGVRLFHWSLVATVFGMYLTAEIHFIDVHVLLGYGLLGLVGFRLLWGFVGGQYARFYSFVFSPAETFAYVRSLRAKQPLHYFGHNPLGALMVFALLAVLTALVATGFLTLGWINFDGVFASSAMQVSDELAYTVRELHDELVDVILILIPLHLLGVVQGSVQHRENLVRAMITGFKPHTDDSQRKE